jgi:magnesium-transporting ATPase (P-type)
VAKNLRRLPSVVMIFSKQPDLDLNRRTDTTISVTVAPKSHDFTAVTPVSHTLTVAELLEELGTSQSDGLSKNEAARRLETCGENVLDGTDGVSALRVLVGQLGTSLRSLFPLHALISMECQQTL